MADALARVKWLIHHHGQGHTSREGSKCFLNTAPPLLSCSLTAVPAHKSPCISHPLDQCTFLMGIFLLSPRSVSESLRGASCHRPALGDLSVAMNTGFTAPELCNALGVAKKGGSERCKETSYRVFSRQYSAWFWGTVSGLFLVPLRVLVKCLELCLLSLLEIFPLIKPICIQEEDQRLLTAATGSSTHRSHGGMLCAVNFP